MKIMFTKLMELVNLYAEDKAEAIKQWNAIAFDKAQLFETVPLRKDSVCRDIMLDLTGISSTIFYQDIEKIIDMSRDENSLVVAQYFAFYGSSMTITAKPEWFTFQEKVVNFDDIKSLDDWNAIDWLAHIKLDDIDSDNSWLSEDHAKVSGLVFVNWNKDNRRRIMAFTNGFPAAKFQVSITSDDSLFKIFSYNLKTKVEAYLEEKELIDDIGEAEGDTNMDTPTPETRSTLVDQTNPSDSTIAQPEIVATESVAATPKPERRFQIQIEDCEYGYVTSNWHNYTRYNCILGKNVTNPEYFSSIEEAKANIEVIAKYEREENDRDEDNEGIDFQIVEIHATVSVKPVVHTEYKYEWTGFDYGLSDTTATANSLAA